MRLCYEAILLQWLRYEQHPSKRRISSVDVNSFLNRTKLERKNTFHFPLSKYLFQEQFPSKWPTQLMHMQIFPKNSLEIKSYLLIPVFLHWKILGKPYFNITSNNKRSDKLRKLFTENCWNSLIKTGCQKMSRVQRLQKNTYIFWWIVSSNLQTHIPFVWHK